MIWFISCTGQIYGRNETSEKVLPLSPLGKEEKLVFLSPFYIVFYHFQGLNISNFTAMSNSKFNRHGGFSSGKLQKEHKTYKRKLLSKISGIAENEMHSRTFSQNQRLFHGSEGFFLFSTTGQNFDSTLKSHVII